MCRITSNQLLGEVNLVCYVNCFTVELYCPAQWETAMMEAADRRCNVDCDDDDGIAVTGALGLRYTGVRSHAASPIFKTLSEVMPSKSSRPLEMRIRHRAHDHIVGSISSLCKDLYGSLSQQSPARCDALDLGHLGSSDTRGSA